MTRLYARIRWYLRELTGESAYDRYLARHARTHPGAEPLSRRDFEHRRTDRADTHPTSRCC